MIELLSRIFIKDRENTNSPSVRSAYGVLCGLTGIFFNVLLTVGKLIAGSMSGSIAVTADALNNLSDAGSSVVTLAAFKLAEKRPDDGHPFGHGRIEYISGLIVSMIILVMGFELGKSSIEKIISPEAVEFSFVAIGVLATSILVKLYMALYNRKIGKKISSSAMKATSIDSLSDCIATSAALVAMFVGKFFSINIDAYAGLLVACFIFYVGIRSCIDTVTPLLGQAPDKEFVEGIHSIVMSYDGVVGIHDLIVHDYGPGRRMVSLHVEVPESNDIAVSHDLIDNIERRLSSELHCQAIIHMDPIVTDNEHLNNVKAAVIEKISEYNNTLSIHDFRMVTGPTHTNLIFDVVVPHNCKLSDNDVDAAIKEIISTIDGDTYFAVIQIDRPYC